jgi:hypothetical protein
MNRNLVGSIYGRFSIHIARFVNKYGHHRQFLRLIGRFLKILLIWNRLAKVTDTCLTCLSGFRVVFVIKLHVCTFLVQCCHVHYDLRVKTTFDSSWLPFCFLGGSRFIYIICIYLRILLFVSFNSKTTSVTCGAGTVDPSAKPEFTSGFSMVRVTRSFVFCVMFCRSLFVLWSIFLLAIVLSVLRFTASDFPFVIFKPFLHKSLELVVIVKFRRVYQCH